MLTIYASSITPRLSYVVETLFEDILGMSVLITQDKERIDGSTACLNYSHEAIADVPFIRPHSLLFEEGIRIIPEQMNASGILFPCESDILDQDILASSFFLLSRYEEYLDTDLDIHGRRMAKNSSMYKAGLLTRPLVDEWALDLFSKLKNRYPDLQEVERAFTILPTFDIDIAYAYKGRNVIRRWKSILKDVFTLKFKRLKERKAVLKGDLQDPYDSYDYQRRICEAHGLESRHFFLIGDRGPMDHNLSHRSQELRSLIKRIDQWSGIGIHPSMGSNGSERKLKKEIARLRKVSGSETTRSRQHFLYLNLPLTYQRLIDLNISEDYSMGYADHIGFRTGTASAIAWYDLTKNHGTALYLFPIAAMDSTLKIIWL